ncbi:MAG: ATP-binding protein [candidate division Zixibacteria bacterium]|nr:ATP-binding protein [candidate division Zixibacteria bacterium]
MNFRFNSPNDPNPARLIESLRCLGYENYGAIADLIDNAIDAEAQRIVLRIYKENGAIRIIIADDGTGMDRDILDQALRLGSLTSKNPVSDLGKFGMGLVTASLSLARKTTLITKKNDVYLTSVADIDHVINSNKFEKYLENSAEKEIRLFETLLADAESGTVVILDNCDGLSNQNTTVFASTLRKRIGQIHRYFLRSHLSVTINDEQAKILDPLELDDPHTEVFSDDVYPVTIKTDDTERTENVKVRIVLIPDKPSAGEREIALGIKNQGFYILRNQREIQAAETLDAFTKHNDFNRMRGEIFLTGDLDKFVGIDFTKRSIVLDQSFKDQLLKHLKAQCTTIKSRESSKSRTKESEEIDELHKSAQRTIDQKAKLLVTPKTNIERRSGASSTSVSKPETKEKTTRANFRLTQPASVQRSKFVYANLGANGQIFECELQGRTIIITWNLQHPFYQRFILDQRSDGRLVTAVDYLIYSMAAAELTMTSDENIDQLNTLKAIISSNMRTLLT